MTTKTTSYWRLAKLPLAVSLASTLAAPAFGVTFNIGEIEGQFDSSLSVGASWSTSKADKDLIGFNNGGRGLSQTSDDSRLNFKRGETFSKIFKGIHDLELKYRDTGIFVRGKYWYDFELKDESRLFKDISDSNRKEGAQSSGGEILDAFIYHNYAIGNQPGSVRLGKQVVSWGESTFIQNSINAINPVDAAAFRRPGAEIKEGLIPVNMFFVSQSLTDNLSMEAFYQIEWDQTVVDNCGTFFAQADVVADGCTDNLAALSPALGNPALLAAADAAGYPYRTTSEGVIIPRGGDRDARDSGQWGVAFRYLFEPLDTEFGFYAMNYHSRTPVFSGQAGPAGVYAAGPAAGQGFVQGAVGPAIQGLVTQACLGGSPLCPGGVPSAALITAITNQVLASPQGQAAAAAGTGLATAMIAGSGNYFMEYPEDIRLYGLSFSTTLPTGTAWSGELSYRPNAPVQLNTVDVLYSGLTPIRPNVSVLQGEPGGTTHGYRRKEITQFQTTFTHFFDQVMGASRLTLVGEIGVTHVGGLESTSKARYGRDPVFGSGELPNGECQVLANSTKGSPSKYCNNDGFVTSTSWGYRARAIWDYPSAIVGVNLRPSVSWSHDVEGYGPNGLFNEGAKAVSLGLDADYQNTYTAGLSYTNFFGGTYNTSVDRDFVALSFGMNF